MEDRAFYQKVVERYLDGTATKEELEVFVHLMNRGELDEYLRMAADEEDDSDIVPYPPAKIKFLHTLSRYGVAAAVFLAIGLGTFFLVRHERLEKAVAVKNDFKNDIL